MDPGYSGCYRRRATPGLGAVFLFFIAKVLFVRGSIFIVKDNDKEDQTNFIVGVVLVTVGIIVAGAALGISIHLYLKSRRKKSRPSVTTTTSTTMTTAENSSNESSPNRVYNVRYSQRPQVHRRSWLLPPAYSPTLKPPPYEETKSDNRLNGPRTNQYPASPPPPYQSQTNQISSAQQPPVGGGFDTGGVFGYNHEPMLPNVPPPTYGATTEGQVQGQRF